MQRFPFAKAIADPQLLRNAWEGDGTKANPGLSWPQKVALKAFYGLPLSHSLVNPKTGWHELDYWAIVQGSCEYDDLGFVTKVIPKAYTPHEYESLWGIIGRRAGKTSTLMAFMLAYEAILGGHEEFIKPGQECVIYLIAHRLNLASMNIPFIRGIINSSPLLSKQIDKDNADGLKLKNGITIVPSPPSLKAQRGMAIPVVAMDEVGFWYTDPESANPDEEVMNAVMYSQLQFPNRKLVGISTPWTKEGLLWRYFLAGTKGEKLSPATSKEGYEDVLVVFGTTASFENPVLARLGRKAIQAIKSKNPDAFPRESLCQFLDSVSGFLNYGLIDQAVQRSTGVAERAPEPSNSRISYTHIAAMDPAFRNDSFGFCIGHRETGKGVVVDVLRRWTPTRGQKLNPKEVLLEIFDLCTSYGVNMVYSDQYQLESLQQIAMDMGFYIEGVDFTARSKAKVYGNLEALFNQGKVVLLDPALSEPAKALVEELVTLEKTRTANGAVQIAAREGRHDDMPTVLALMAFKSAWTQAEVEVEEEKDPEPSLFDRGMATLHKRQRIDESGYF